MHATGALTPDRLERGYRMVTVTGDLQAMKLGMDAELDRARGNDVGGSSGSMY
jgi:hypothetical protein